jgi:hypothetical protein
LKRLQQRRDRLARISRLASWAVCAAILVASSKLPTVRGWQQSSTRSRASNVEAAFTAVTEENLRKYVSEIASDAYEGRGAGYPGAQRAAEYIAHEFERSGLVPMGDILDGRRSYYQTFGFYPNLPPIPWQKLRTCNVLGFVEGTDQILKHELVVIGAHFDGQGQLGEADPGRSAARDPRDARKTIWNSADDNASGMAAVLSIARALQQSGLKTRRSILFVAFGAEEHGLIGSLYYVAHPAFSWKHHVAMMTFEQLGRRPEMELVVAGTGTSPVWMDLIAHANQMTGMKATSLTNEIIQDTDHYGFAVRGVPGVNININHDDDIHEPTDTWDKMDFSRFAQRTRYGLDVLVQLANMAKRPAFAGRPPCNDSVLEKNLANRCSSPNDPGVVLAEPTPAELKIAKVAPPYGGLKVVAVVAGLSSEGAGLRPGDLIIGIGKQALGRPESKRRLHQALSESNHDVPILVVRNRTRMNLTIRLNRQ